jgi:hypothetical protein
VLRNDLGNAPTMVDATVCPEVREKEKPDASRVREVSPEASDTVGEVCDARSHAMFPAASFSQGNEREGQMLALKTQKETAS